VTVGPHDQVRGRNPQPGEAPEGWIATFSDPDDNYFQLLSPME
jgi:predicted enzyme related to lactoylglutathione lyase